MNDHAPALETEQLEIRSLTPDPKNARKHDAKNLAAIRASLERFGQRKPIVVQRRGEELIVRAGNGTLEAATQLGWTLIAATVIEEDDREAAAYAIADNRTAELAEWDKDVLSDVLADLEAEDFDLDLTGFDDRDRLRLSGGRQGLTDPDEIPAQPETRCRPGDLWLLGRHRLLCGSSAEAADVARLLDGAEPELMVTDPPYGVELDMEWRDRAGKNALGAAQPSYMQRQDGHSNTSISGDTIADWSPAFELVPSLRVIYAWHASSFTVEVGAGLQRIGFELRQMIVWRKPHFVLSRTHYHYQTEPCWYAVRRGKTSAWIGSRDQSNLWDAASPKQLMAGSNEEKHDHPTQKPLVCMERPIQNHDFPDVYEPFSGSGTTLMACERQDRRCFAMELDPKYVDVAVARWEAFTGRSATRVPA